MQGENLVEQKEKEKNAAKTIQQTKIKLKITKQPLASTN
jgi:hypothetical protein